MEQVRQARNVAVFIFEQVEPLDFAGPLKSEPYKRQILWNMIGRRLEIFHSRVQKLVETL
ncbi:hypothetical protein [Paenibacillus silvae]|uniref:Uncharacterized protein n=1 Tax=Paenibacillus silvae TaxID=1325358 RepID=A0A2W6N9Z7_9BACL|nr:hypothetical protein [Paenibacillus silvae]PZT52767.1 hypothetical protein DN757_25505 [Paenibacillus silvae]